MNNCKSQALTDKIPFADIQLEPQLIIALVQGKSPNDTKDLLTYPRQLGDLLARCWSREPNQRPLAVDCIHVVESTLPRLEKKGSSDITELARHASLPPLPPLTGLSPSPTMGDRPPNIMSNFTSNSTQHHGSNDPQEESRTLASSPQGSAPLKQRAVNQARQAQEFGQKSQGSQLNQLRKRNRHPFMTVSDVREPANSNSTPVNGFSPKLSPAERSVLAQRLEEPKREARYAVASASISASASGSVTSQPVAEWACSTRQEATIREVSSEAGPSNFVPTPNAGPSLTSNPMDNSELLESPGNSRLRIRKPYFTVYPATRVLLVDDDQVCRRIYCKLLQVLGCAVDIAVDGDDAVNKMNPEKYELDIVMPKLDGVSATSLIRQFDRRTPIIAITSDSKPNDVATYYSSGMNDILPKPFTRESLFTMITKHIRGRRPIKIMLAKPRGPLSEDQYLKSSRNLFGRKDGRDPLSPLDRPSGAVMTTTNGARAGKRTLEGVDDDRE
ncbi:hypothetical protein FRC00_005169, partial [Tulasnella sp. 408]